MKIAIVGSGIAGLTAAYQLNKKYDITLYEAAAQIGGHTATRTVTVDSGEYAIDTGFIVFNDWTYPNFIKLMDTLGVESQPTEMGFSAFYADGRFEYSGTNLNTLFSDRKTLLSPKHWRMLKEIVRFNKQAKSDWQSGQISPTMTLGKYLCANGYSAAFKHRYIVPMGSAIWSSSTAEMESFPLQFFIKFFDNHGLLNISDRPCWRVIRGGSSRYIAPLTSSFAGKIRVDDPVNSIRRSDCGVLVSSREGAREYDHVIMACHADQALALMHDASMAEKNTLSAIGYRDNSVVLHTDTGLLPSRRRTWSSWNYCLNDSSQQLPILTYNMNILQGLNSPETFCVTLNAEDRIDPSKVLGRYSYAHPVFTQAALKAQSQWQSINGVNRTWFCGAYWLNGFHEDGVNSALRVSEALGVPSL